MSLEVFNKFAKLQGLRFFPESHTPVLGKPRGQEIKTWLELAVSSGILSGSDFKYVVLDDEAVQDENLVRTMFSTGLTPEHVEKALKILS